MAYAQALPHLFQFLTAHQLIQDVFNQTVYYDEPPSFFYSLLPNKNAPFFHSKKRVVTKKISGLASSGVSFFDKEFALYKSAMEFIERISNYSYGANAVIRGKGAKKLPRMDMRSFSPLTPSEENEMGWVKGVELHTNQPHLIPAQLIYINYAENNKERQLGPYITTGSSCAGDKSSALLHGIFEVVERDAFMNMYLGKIPLARVDLSSLKSEAIDAIVSRFHRYRLSISVYKATNDIPLPVFVAVAVDQSGIGPSVSIGSKCSLDEEKAVIGAIEETCLSRPWIRKQISSDITLKHVSPSDITTVENRALFWTPQTMVTRLDFLLKTKNKCVLRPARHHKKTSAAGQLEQVSRILNSLGLRVYFVPTLDPFFAPLAIHTVKVIIPGLQPLYLNETDRIFIHKERLDAVMRYFRIPQYNINEIPHPFL